MIGCCTNFIIVHVLLPNVSISSPAPSVTFNTFVLFHILHISIVSFISQYNANIN